MFCIRGENNMNVLFIGNSYTYYHEMPFLFEQLANSNGKTVTVHSITKGGRRLEEFTDSSDPITAALDTILSNEKFDICFIQEQSVLPAADFDRFIHGLDCVVSKVKNKTDRLVLYATWGRKSGSDILTEYHWTTEHMTNLLADAYQKAANRYGALVSPVGSRFLSISQKYPEINLYIEDCSHPSYQGSCLAALTHFHSVFHDFPTHTDILALSDAELSAFRSAICRSV